MASRVRNLVRLMRLRLSSGKGTTIPFSVAKQSNGGDLDKLLSQKVKADKLSLKPRDVAESTLLSPGCRERSLHEVQRLMHEAIHMKKTDLPDLALGQLREEYQKLDLACKHQALVLLATEFGVDRRRLQRLTNHYITLASGEAESSPRDAEDGEDGVQAARCKAERDLRAALVPLSARLFEQLNGQAGGLKFLVDLRADLLSALKLHNLASLRALDADLRGMLATWLGPACLELKQITWNDAAGLLEKIVAYEAVHPITNIYDLKRRLGVGRRCFGYFHSALPGEPLVFIEVAMSDKISSSIQSVLSDENPIDESAADTAVFYSISSTQPGLAGIELGTFLIKRVVQLLQQDMPQVETFVTLSPIPGFLQWLLPKLVTQFHPSASQRMEQTGTIPQSGALNKDNVLLPAEERTILEAAGQAMKGENGAKVLFQLLTSPRYSWVESATLMKALQGPLMRLCARRKKRGRALDPVANFHVRNGAGVERLNWMGDTSAKGLAASAGMMVNYIYRLDRIETNNQKYLNKGTIDVSPLVEKYLEVELDV